MDDPYENWKHPMKEDVEEKVICLFVCLLINHLPIFKGICAEEKNNFSVLEI